MSPIQLLDLPIEILTEIAFALRENGGTTGSWFCHEKQRWTSKESQADLIALGRTCKIFNAVTNTALYYAPFGCHAKLLRTLLDRPDLLSLVRAIDYNPQAYEEIQEDNEAHFDHVNIVFELWEHQLIKSTCQRLGLGPSLSQDSNLDDAWIFRCLLDLLLALVANNIEAIRLLSPRHLPSLVHLASPLAGSRVILPRLRFFAVSHCRIPEFNGFDLKTYKYLLDLCPNLEFLWLTTCAKIPPLYLPKLRSLRMFACSLGLQSLKNILPKSAMLEDFCCSERIAWAWEGDAPGDLYEDQFVMRDVERLLRPMAKTLRHLILDPGFYESTPSKTVKEELGLRSLADFDQLKTLLVHPRYFQDAEITQEHKFVDTNRFIEQLPKGIKYLAVPTIYAPGLHGPPIRLSHAIQGDELPNLVTLAFPSYPSTDEAFKKIRWYGGDWTGSMWSSDVGYKCIRCTSTESPCGLPTFNFVPGKHFLRSNPNNWWEARHMPPDAVARKALRDRHDSWLEQLLH